MYDFGNETLKKKPIRFQLNEIISLIELIVNQKRRSNDAIFAFMTIICNAN